MQVCDVYHSFSMHIIKYSSIKIHGLAPNATKTKKYKKSENFVVASQRNIIPKTKVFLSSKFIFKMNTNYHHTLLLF
jgi:hypothetical protein